METFVTFVVGAFFVFVTLVVVFYIFVVPLGVLVTIVFGISGEIKKNRNEKKSNILATSKKNNEHRERLEDLTGDQLRRTIIGFLKENHEIDKDLSKQKEKRSGWTSLQISIDPPVRQENRYLKREVNKRIYLGMKVSDVSPDGHISLYRNFRHSKDFPVYPLHTP